MELHLCGDLVEVFYGLVKISRENFVRTLCLSCYKTVYLEVNNDEQSLYILQLHESFDFELYLFIRKEIKKFETFTRMGNSGIKVRENCGVVMV